MEMSWLAVYITNTLARVTVSVLKENISCLNDLISCRPTIMYYNIYNKSPTCFIPRPLASGQGIM